VKLRGFALDGQWCLRLVDQALTEALDVGGLCVGIDSPENAIDDDLQGDGGGACVAVGLPPRFKDSKHGFGEPGNGGEFFLAGQVGHTFPRDLFLGQPWPPMRFPEWVATYLPSGPMRAAVRGFASAQA
jgi:hypothetical protein